MNEEEAPPSDENELSEDDLAVLRAFEAMEDWNVASDSSVVSAASATWSEPPTSAIAAQERPDAGDDFGEMLLVFVSEVEEDIARMQRVLNQLEQDDHIQATRFVPLKRAAHKIRGTAGAVECPHIATIGRHIEVIVEQITESVIFPLIGVNALAKAVSVLERTLES